MGPLLLSTFLPTLLFSIGEGAIIPLLPAAAGDLGATLALAGLVAGPALNAPASALSARARWLIGPFLSAGAIHLTGSVESVFWVHLLCCVAAVVVLLLVPDPVTVLRRAQREHRGVLARMGSGAAVIGALRASRTLILPLWAVSIGLADTGIAIIVGIAGALDFALFFFGGQLMDSFGRAATAIPSMIGSGLGHLALAASLLAADPAPFLGAFRFTGDAGNAAAPIVVSALTALVSLPFAAVAMGVLGLGGAGVLARGIPRSLPPTAPRG
ncbi:hypothetical protein C5C18_07375 [Rathayibacter tritici]|uniref:hypothetical protein n=1 Tax=Rathayibacter tritici TaxID=33888 RepID=UPI000CE9142B|nr:hypothetical protein [Rathayibacter tritici]PPF68679.1 hypothetical protein C5C21_04685 [Rathayibacter tritici]PPG07355.1 hypothetical protein C5C18_07375 [Rathayibacter tritici]